MCVGEGPRDNKGAGRGFRHHSGGGGGGGGGPAAAAAAAAAARAARRTLWSTRGTDGGGAR